MGCVYCQNYAIAKAMYGTRLEPSRLSDIFLELQEQGAENINLVTASHYLYLIIPAIEKAKRQGLKVPVVYNTGAYERVEAIQALEGLVDIWLPDFKYISPRISLAYSHTPDYFQYASKALAEMVRQCPHPLFADGSSSIDAKDDADDVSHETLKAICEAVSIPVIAIGGISRNNVMELAGSGICGIAVISAIFAQPDIEAATKELRTLTEQMVES